MPLSTCPRCEKLYDKANAVVCPSCLTDEEDDYERVRQALQGNAEMSAEDLSETEGIDIKCILRFLEDGRIETTAANNSVVCGRCGAPAISLSKRLCESCLQKLNAELTMQQGEIQLTKKKRVVVDTAFNVRDTGSAVKYQR